MPRRLLQEKRVMFKKRAAKDSLLMPRLFVEKANLADLNQSDAAFCINYKFEDLSNIFSSSPFWSIGVGGTAIVVLRTVVRNVSATDTSQGHFSAAVLVITALLVMDTIFLCIKSFEVFLRVSRMLTGNLWELLRCV